MSTSRERIRYADPGEAFRRVLGGVAIVGVVVFVAGMVIGRGFTTSTGLLIVGVAVIGWPLTLLGIQAFSSPTILQFVADTVLLGALSWGVLKLIERVSPDLLPLEVVTGAPYEFVLGGALIVTVVLFVLDAYL